MRITEARLQIADVRIEYVGPRYGTNGSPTAGQLYAVEYTSEGIRQKVLVTIGSQWTLLAEQAGSSLSTRREIIAHAIRDRVESLAKHDALVPEMDFDDSIFMPYQKCLEK